MQFDATIQGATARVEVREKNGAYSVTVGEKTYEIDWADAGASFVSAAAGAASVDAAIEKTSEGFAVVFDGRRFDVEIQEAAKGAVVAKHGASGPSKLVSPMPGKIVKILVAAGDAVEASQGLVVMEAMKMENELKASRAGTVREIRVAEGQAVETGALLVVVD